MWDLLQQVRVGLILEHPPARQILGVPPWKKEKRRPAGCKIFVEVQLGVLTCQVMQIVVFI